MGACVSCASRRSSSAVRGVRVVHLNGYVEDFEHPVSVAQVTGHVPKLFVCTAAQLLCAGSKPLQADSQLVPGSIYFLLPYSILQPDVSPLDLASTVKKLTAAAKSGRQYEAKSPQASPLWSQYGSSPGFNSPARSPSRFMEPVAPLPAYGAQRSARARSWRPKLDTIGERSFNRRSESDLQEKIPRK